jgi:hypothetical protein
MGIGLGQRGAWAAEEDALVSKWQHLVSVRAMGGYKDNVLLSAELPDESPFVGAGLELIGWRPLGENSEFLGFLVGEHRQFLDALEVDYEQTFVGQAQLEVDLGEAWTLTGPLEYLYVDQVLDVSATEVEVQATRVQGQSLGLRPSVQHHFSAGTMVLEAAGHRQLYEQPLDDSWEVETEILWQHPLAERTRSDLFYGFRQTWFDSDQERDADGVEIDGTHRKMQRHELGWKLRYEWGERRSWRLMGTVSGQYADDLASGFYDFIRPLADLRLRYRAKGWTIEGTARARWYHYPVQTVSDTDDTLRRRSEFILELRGEREILSWLQVFAEYSHEQTFANRSAEEYSVNTVSCGLEVLF